MSLKLTITDNWGTGFGAELLITNNKSYYCNYSVTMKINKSKIEWCDNLTISKNNKNETLLTMQKWVNSLAPKENVTIKFGGSGSAPLLKDFKLTLTQTKPIPGPEPGPVPPQPGPSPTFNDKSVIGLPDKFYQIYNTTDIIDLSQNKNITKIYLSNKKIGQITDLKIKILEIGTSCLKIIFNDNSVRLFGIYVNGFNKKIEDINKVQIGSVSEDDPTSSIKFWSDFTDNQLTSKYCELRYIYLNGGPGNYGWRYNYSTPEYNLEPLGQRAVKFIRNSFRLGMIPCFVYYNIPDNGESYMTDLAHIQDKNYMKNYFIDLKFLLDLINTETKSELPVYIIFEPDSLGYMMQNTGKGKNSPFYKEGSEIQAYVSPLYELGYLNLTEKFSDTLEGLVKSINYLCKKTCQNIKIGWQINVWSSTYSGKVIPGGMSLMKVSDTIGIEEGKKFIIREAQEIGNYYKKCGILENADFFSVDKYGLSFRGVTLSALTDAIKSDWGWNSDHWLNYLLYCQNLSIALDNKKCILWQIPSAHLNSSESINPISKTKFKDISNTPGAYEDSSISFFFGDIFTPKLMNEQKYWEKDEWKSGLVTSKENKINWKGTIKDLIKYNIFCFLSGAGVGADTHSGGLTRPVTDDYFFISKVQEYYNI